MLASAAAVVAGLFIGTNSTGAGADHSSKTGTWCGSLVLELLAVVPFLCAIPSLFHEIASSNLLHAKAADAVSVPLGLSELLPMAAILPFMLYQLAGFGTLHFVVPRPVNWALNIGILVLIVASYVANRQAAFVTERVLTSALVVVLALTVLQGVLKLRQMQARYDEHVPPKPPK